MNTINFQLNLLNVLLWAIIFLTRVMFAMTHISHKGYVCYDPSSNRLCISRHVVFFENQFFFPIHVKSSPEPLFFLILDDVSTTFERFKPGLVYK